MGTRSSLKYPLLLPGRNTNPVVFEQNKKAIISLQVRQREFGCPAMMDEVFSKDKKDLFKQRICKNLNVFDIKGSFEGGKIRMRNAKEK